MTMRRRDALKTIGGLAGAAGIAKFLPGCGDGDDGGPTGITTYVFLMMENRTYDHVLGGRALEGLGGDGLRTGLGNPDLEGALVAPYVPTDVQMCTQGDPPHNWDASHAQWNNGAMDGFVRAHQAGHPGAIDPMQYLVRDQQPASWAIADHYTTCDRWFASVMGGTLPNRAYWHTGTSFGLDTNNEVLDKFSNGVPVPTIYNRLDEKGIDWAYYYGSLAVVSLLGSPGPYALDLGPNDGTGRIRRFGDALQAGGQFFRDAAAGVLPPVVYIDPSFFENDDHPPIHPILGQELIAAVYTALATSPQWKNCMLVVTYDEHGGFYDHVAPPTTTDDTLAKYGVGGFEQLGFRVPAMIAGPYVKQGYVSSVQLDHTSALKHLQNTFGLDSLTARVDAANDLSDAIDMERLAAGDWAQPAAIPMVDRTEYPTTDPRCSSGGGFRRDPISEWADAHPGAFRPEYDIREQSEGQRTIQEFLATHRGAGRHRP
ncbi:MAG: alkaline phosphatase family protein [Myxococcota bacterium]|nr:alkaline phosphatase family protein [Myxococcota bacterium]